MQNADSAQRTSAARPSPLSSMRVGIATLRINPLRTFLSTLGVVIGVASLVAVLSLGDGMESFARREMERTTGVQNVYVTPVLSDLLDGIAIPRERVPLFGVDDARAAAAGVPSAASVAINYSGTTTLVAPDGRTRAARVSAATASAAAFYGVETAHGRFFTEAEVAGDSPVVVVSHPLAAVLAGSGAVESVPGRRVELRGGARTVVGVLPPEERDGGLAVYVPLGAGPRVMLPGEAERPRPLVLKAPRVEEVAAVRAATERWLAGRYGDWRKDYTVGTEQARTEQMMRGLLLFKVFMGAITAISLLVGGIGIMNVLLASVTERTREIGIRKAVGARRRDIVLQFLSESVAITGSGSLVGLLLGVAAAFAITGGMRTWLDAPIHAGLSLSTMLVAALSALIVGLSFGTYPALRAARLSPIDAIRHE
ncbi:MAG TPA: ABC transporter permease [Longimicrobiaceae bacterium]|nr:ABC transporter permease [Longimicrobiaceae bacterium]